MIYTMKSHETKYKNVVFRSRLEARWAAFFDLAGWTWEYEPVDLDGWTPDFLVQFPCGHSECPKFHHLYIEVKPFGDIKDFEGLIVSKIDSYSIPSPAVFGLNPSVTQWEMSHGPGGGLFSVTDRIENSTDLWNQAGNLTRYRKHS
jgi:hypothetical protein